MSSPSMPPTDRDRDREQAEAVMEASHMGSFLAEPFRARLRDTVQNAIRIAREEGERAGREGRIQCNSDQELTTLHEMVHLEWHQRYPRGNLPREETIERKAERLRWARAWAAKEQGNCVQCDRNGPVGESCSCGLHFSPKPRATP